MRRATTITQPAGGGRKRLYCSNAHRAEARRLRIAETPEPDPADLLSATLERLAAVVVDLRRHQGAVRAVDPARHTLELTILTDDLNQSRVAADVNAARAESADQRAAVAEDAARAAAAGAERTQIENNRLTVVLAQTHGLVDLATARAETAERLLSDARGELLIERARHDAHVVQLDRQIMRLASRKRRSPTKSTPSVQQGEALIRTASPSSPE